MVPKLILVLVHVNIDEKEKNIWEIFNVWILAPSILIHSLYFGHIWTCSDMLQHFHT